MLAFRNPLKPSRYFMHHQVWHLKKILRSIHRVNFYYFYAPQIKQQLFPNTVVLDWLCNRSSVFTVRYELEFKYHSG
jgi:hypothetical protein